jgi:hypothetical protein
MKHTVGFHNLPTNIFDLVQLRKAAVQNGNSILSDNFWEKFQFSTPVVIEGSMVVQMIPWETGEDANVKWDSVNSFLMSNKMKLNKFCDCIVLRAF